MTPQKIDGGEYLTVAEAVEEGAGRWRAGGLLVQFLPQSVDRARLADLPPGEPPSFSIGGIRMVAANVCRRCVVPSRDSRTGAVTELFRDMFEARRRRGLRGGTRGGTEGRCSGGSQSRSRGTSRCR